MELEEEEWETPELHDARPGRDCGKAKLNPRDGCIGNPIVRERKRHEREERRSSKKRLLCIGCERSLPDNWKGCCRMKRCNVVLCKRCMNEHDSLCPDHWHQSNAGSRAQKHDEEDILRRPRDREDRGCPKASKVEASVEHAVRALSGFLESRTR